MKFPTENGEISNIYVDQRVARECYAAGLKMKNSRTTTNIGDSRNMMAMIDTRMNYGERWKPKEETTSIGGSLPEELASRLIAI